MFLKIILYLFIVAAVLFIGFWAIIIASFAVSARFYVPVIFFSGISLLVLVLLQMFHFVKSKKMKIAWITFLSLLVVSCGVYEGRSAYDRSIARIREGDVNLYLYSPYAKNTNAVTLDEPSTLKLETDLPLLDGATALYPLYAAFAQAVYPKKTYYFYDSEVACSNTICSYQSLINKEVDIIFVAPPSKEQLEIAEKAGVSFRFTPIGKEAFVFFVNAHNPVDDLTVEQLQAVYSGEITNWKEVGGKDETIRPFQRNKNSGSQTAFIHFMNGKTIRKAPKEDVPGEMGGMISRTADYANYGNAIGFSFRFYASEMVNNKDVKLLKINGIYPDMETIRSGEYPLSSQFFAVTLSDNDRPNVLKLLDWIVSEQGQQLVEKTGYCPVK
jgi:phosphate transport system substrate-binding protein